jgi:hypothetical protein
MVGQLRVSSREQHFEVNVHPVTRDRSVARGSDTSGRSTRHVLVRQRRKVNDSTALSKGVNDPVTSDVSRITNGVYLVGAKFDAGGDGTKTYGDRSVLFPK